MTKISSLILDNAVLPSEMLEKINNSPQLQDLYFEAQSLRKKIVENIEESFVIQERLENVRDEYRKLSTKYVFKFLLEEKKKGELKKVSSVKAKKELYSKMETHCGICLEHHEYVDVCTLPCNHEYGTKCFENWYTTGSKTCPECRNPTKEIKTYRFVPFDTVKTRKTFEMEHKILESSPQMVLLYCEIQTLKKKFEKITSDLSETRSRFIYILEELNVLISATNISP